MTEKEEIYGKKSENKTSNWYTSDFISSIVIKGARTKLFFSYALGRQKGVKK